MKKIISFVLAAIFMLSAISFTGCSKADDNKVVIYTCIEDYVIEYMTTRLSEKFPDYDIKIQYISTGDLSAKFKSSGKEIECDIFADLDRNYASMVKEYFADISEYDNSKYLPDLLDSDNKYLPFVRYSGCIIINPDLLSEKGVAAPTSYSDLLKPEYKELISMPSPKKSGTGYMFLKSLVNAYGEDEAFTYFDKLAENILQFTSNGSGPVNALVQGEAAIGLGMTAQAVDEISGGVNLEIKYFDEGAPFNVDTFGIVEGRQDKKAVKDVFEFFNSTLVPEITEKYMPEQIYIEQDNSVPNYPKEIKYADMSNNTPSEKERLLNKWMY